MRVYSSQTVYLVDNSQDIPAYQTRPSLRKTASTLTGGLPYYEYVIITSNSLKPCFDKFVRWKKRKGLNIDIVTTEEIASHYVRDARISNINDPEVNPAGRIRDYLYDAYYEGETVYVLLGGDFSVVPIMYGTGGQNNSYDYPFNYEFYSPGGYLPVIDNDCKVPSDLYFADLTADWQTDGDEYFGEPGEIDANPELFVGRLLCTSEQDILNWTEKVLKYEQNPGNGDHSYLTKAFFFEADQMQEDQEAESVKNNLPSIFSTEIIKEQPSATNYVGH